MNPIRHLKPLTLSLSLLVAVAMNVEAQADNFTIGETWPINPADLGGLPIAQAKTNFSFVIKATSNISANPIATNWPVAYTIPLSTLIPFGTLGNKWDLHLSTAFLGSQFFITQITNVTNGGISPPFGEPIALWTVNQGSQDRITRP